MLLCEAQFQNTQIIATLLYLQNNTPFSTSSGATMALVCDLIVGSIKPCFVSWVILTTLFLCLKLVPVW